jgi:hypothetical protein
VPVSARKGEGVVLDFKPQAGEAFLNGIQLKRVF